MIKIGIITLSASDNCGSCLQAYALKKILENYGDVDIINFSSLASHMMYDIPKVTLRRKIEFYFDKKLVNKYRNLEKCKKAYAEFRTKFLNIDVNEEIMSDQLENISNKYDIFVAGSDQVWNVKMGDFDEAFFLGWTLKKKVAYAPSLGGRDVRMANNAKQYIMWINEFEHISVREEIGKQCLEEITDKIVTKTVDPTLLLADYQWRELIDKPMVQGKYIFYYSWAYCYEEEMQIVVKEGKRLGLPVIVIDSRKWLNKDENDYGFILSEEEGPLAFLNLMYYASHVYVESFHGMVFSYIFKKNFWLLDLHDNINELDSRLKEFIHLLKAENRIVTPYNYNEIDMDRQMEYYYNLNLEDLKEVSHKYLDEAMKL